MNLKNCSNLFGKTKILIEELWSIEWAKRINQVLLIGEAQEFRCGEKFN